VAEAETAGLKPGDKKEQGLGLGKISVQGGLSLFWERTHLLGSALW
jgi:hypothetical protein